MYTYLFIIFQNTHEGNGIFFHATDEKYVLPKDANPGGAFTFRG
jgi:hypothetical protein